MQNNSSANNKTVVTKETAITGKVTIKGSISLSPTIFDGGTEAGPMSFFAIFLGGGAGDFGKVNFDGSVEFTEFTVKETTTTAAYPIRHDWRNKKKKKKKAQN